MSRSTRSNEDVVTTVSTTEKASSTAISGVSTAVSALALSFFLFFFSFATKVPSISCGLQDTQVNGRLPSRSFRGRGGPALSEAGGHSASAVGTSSSPWAEVLTHW